MAPLYGIVRDALSQQHQGQIYLYHGSSHAEGLYYQAELTELRDNHPEFHYLSCLSGSKPSSGERVGRASDIALTEHPKLAGWRVYLCGSPEMVNATQRSAFLAGAAMQDIHKDAFVTA